MNKIQSRRGVKPPPVSLELSFPQGYCVFEDDKLHSWSAEFEKRYPAVLDHLYIGLNYIEFFQLISECSDIRDSLWLDDPELWVQKHVEEKVPFSEFIYSSHGERWLSNRIFALNDRCWVLTCADITDISVDLGLMNIKAQKFERFAILASNWFWELDENLCYLYHSSHKQPLAGSDAKSLVGESRILKLNGMVVEDEQFHEHNRCLIEHQIVNVVLAWRREGGVFIYSHILAEPQFDENKKFLGYLGSGRDITEQKEMAKQIAQSRKMESMGQLAAGIAHEINTPTQFVGDNTRFLGDAFADVSALLGSYNTLLQAARNDTVTPQLLEDIDSAIEQADTDYLETEIPGAIEQSIQGLDRISKIVLAMKEFSHPGGEEKSLANLNTIIENTIVISSNEWKYIAKIVTDFDSNLPPVPCHSHEISQVVLNLIINSVHALADRYGESNGAVGEIEISTALVEGMAQIKVADSGYGMSEDVQARVFDYFFTTKAVGKGTGQGLSMAYAAIVDGHGGDIKLASTLGEGTVFTIHLPLSLTKKEAA